MQARLHGSCRERHASGAGREGLATTLCDLIAANGWRILGSRPGSFGERFVGRCHGGFVDVIEIQSSSLYRHRWTVSLGVGRTPGITRGEVFGGRFSGALQRIGALVDEATRRAAGAVDPHVDDAWWDGYSLENVRSVADVVLAVDGTFFRPELYEIAGHDERLAEARRHAEAIIALARGLDAPPADLVAQPKRADRCCRVFVWRWSRSGPVHSPGRPGVSTISSRDGSQATARLRRSRVWSS